MKRLCLFLACFVFVGVNLLQAQTVQITGTVTSAEDGMPIPGASVVVKGTSIGVSTDANGKYTLAVPTSANTLGYSFIGFKPQEVPIGGRTVIDVILESDALSLEEVVVTALGISRDKRTLGYSVQQVGGEELNKVQQTDALSALQGRVAGVQIRSTTNMGGSSKILIRGASSMLGDNNPLIIVDGIPMDNSNYNAYGAQTGGGGVDYGNMLNDVNPSEIESMSILKGAAAALYGSRAANGVILITTKSAKKGKESFSVDFNASVDFDQISVIPELQQKYGGGAIIGAAGGGVNGFFQTVVNGQTYNTIPYWVDESWGPRYDPNIQVVDWWGAEDYAKGLTSAPETTPWVAPANDNRTFWNLGKTVNSSIGINKTGENYGVRFAYSNAMTEGTMPGSEMMKNSFKLSSNANLTEKFSVSSSITYTSSYAKGRPVLGYDGNSIGQQMFQWGMVHLDYEKLKTYKNTDGTQRVWNRDSFVNSAPKYMDNPYWTAYENYPEDKRDRFFGNILLNYQITDDLSLTGTVNGDAYTFHVRERTSLGSKEQSVYSEIVRVNSDFNSSVRLNYSKQLIEDLEFTGIIGVERRSVRYDSNSGRTSGGLVVPGLFTLTNSNNDPTIGDYTSEKMVNSALSSFSFSYKRFLNTEFSLRNDWSSALPNQNNSYLYYGAAGSFVFSELVKIPYTDLAKVRVGYTQVGNDTDPYRVYSTYNYNANGAFGSTPRLSVSNSMANPDLKAETTTSSEIGLDLVFLKNRIDLSVTYYNKATTDQIMGLQTSRATGYTQKLINAGQLTTKGWEASLGINPVRTKDFDWNIRTNFTMAKQIVDKLVDGIETLDIAAVPFGGVTLRASVGDEYGQLWGYDYLYDDQGNKVVGATGYWRRTQSLVPLGSVYPDFNMGIGNNFRYKDIDFGFLIDIQKGGVFYSLTHMWGMYSGMFPESAGVNHLGNEIRSPIIAGGNDPSSGGLVLDGVTGTVTFNPDGTYTVTGTAPNTTFVTGRGWAARHYEGYGMPSAQNVFKADYMKLREVSLGYTYGKPLFNGAIRQIRVSAYGRNLLTWGLDKPGFDPEMTVGGSGNIQGMEGGLQPSFRSFGLNLKLQF